MAEHLGLISQRFEMFRRMIEESFGKLARGGIEGDSVGCRGARGGVRGSIPLRQKRYGGQGGSGSFLRNNSFGDRATDGARFGGGGRSFPFALKTATQNQSDSLDRDLERQKWLSDQILRAAERRVSASRKVAVARDENNRCAMV